MANIVLCVHHRILLVGHGIVHANKTNISSLMHLTLNKVYKINKPIS